MPLRFKLDENLPQDAATHLRDAGHDVHTVIDESLGGQPDQRVFDAAQAEHRILVTLDLDFADIRQYPPSSHCGVWVLRPRTQSIANTLDILGRALALSERETVRARLWVVEVSQVRIRE